jgi:hypothetical protein
MNTDLVDFFFTRKMGWLNLEGDRYAPRVRLSPTPAPHQLWHD